jgi:hypothetical protein
MGTSLFLRALEAVVLVAEFLGYASWATCIAASGKGAMLYRVGSGSAALEAAVGLNDINAFLATLKPSALPNQ